ncbi:MAG: SemiSWEET transporter [Chlorobiota bacterium]|jgi:MtN3 and saliva related transmembrane protein|nr:SemiSWEET transporter [Chlorobiota bacterium]QQS65852.1 MAG: SemiSWEET transporter [Chlorobiota bacterium]
MEINFIKTIGFVAGLFSTFALAPQAIKIYKTKKVDQISIGMLSLMLTGASLWLVYGLLEDDMNIIWANCVGLIFIIFMLVFKIKDKGQLS